MREIKFRAWDKQEKKFVFSDIDFVVLNNKPHSLNGYGYDLCGRTYWGNIEQYTGLKDKNGVEIYYGDKCKYIDIVGNKGIVTVGFEEGSFIIFKGLSYRYFHEIDTKKLEVIGNIHEV